MSAFSRAIAFLFGLTVLLAGAVASAQTVTLSTEPPARLVNVDGRTSANRNKISKGDCMANDVFTFHANLTGYESYTLEVWAGSAVCTTYESRQGTSPQCWKVYASGTPASTMEIQIRVQDIAAENLITDSPNGPNSGTLADCDNPVNAQSVTLYFMLVDSSHQVPTTGTGATFATSFDLVGPDAPTGLSAGEAESMLALSWTPSPSSGVRGYYFYCVPEDTVGTGGTGGGGTSSAAGAGGDTVGGGTSSAAGAGGDTVATATGGSTGTLTQAIDCAQGVLYDGMTVTSAIHSEYLCGTAYERVTSSKFTDDTLTNGTTYAVGIAAFDDLGNIGPLSTTACGKPVIVTDFYELYGLSGGKGGGGFCSVSRQSGTSLGLLVGAGAVAWVVRRRRAR
jgi:hypothetical protein